MGAVRKRQRNEKMPVSGGPVQVFHCLLHEQMRIGCHICRKAGGGIVTQCRVGRALSELQAGKGEQKGEGLMMTELRIFVEFP